jgi:hypothetical protein
MLQAERILWNFGGFESRLSIVAETCACGNIDMFICGEILQNFDTSKPHLAIRRTCVHACDRHHHDYE